MSCYICSGKNDDVKLDHRDMKIAPCGSCEAVIQECLDGYPNIDDNDEADEFLLEETFDEEFVDEDYFEGVLIRGPTSFNH